VKTPVKLSLLVEWLARDPVAAILACDNAIVDPAMLKESSQIESTQDILNLGHCRAQEKTHENWWVPNESQFSGQKPIEIALLAEWVARDPTLALAICDKALLDEDAKPCGTRDVLELGYRQAQAIEGEWASYTECASYSEWS